MESNKPDEPAVLSTGTSVSDQPSWFSSLSLQVRELRREMSERRRNPPADRHPDEVREIWGKRRYKAQALSFAGYAALIGVAFTLPPRSVKGAPSDGTMIDLASNRPIETHLIQPPIPVVPKPPDIAGDENASANGTGTPRVRRPEIAPPPKPAKQPGGGGGGGKQDLTPATVGAIPEFSTHQVTVPMPVALNNHPEIAAPPTLLADNARPYDLSILTPKIIGLLDGPTAPPSSGRGTEGGIGQGRGKGIGPSDGTGLGPGCCIGTGGDRGTSVPNVAGLIPGNGGKDGPPGGRGGNGLRGSITEPVVIVKTKPSYSEDARKNKIQGTVILEALVREDGSVDGSNIRVVKTQGYGLDESAIADVKAWKFKPATQDGRPIPRTVRIEVNFALR